MAVRSAALSPQRLAIAAVTVTVGVVGACASGSDGASGKEEAPAATTAPPPPLDDTSSTTTMESESSTTTTTEPDPFARPDWLGTRPLPLRPDGLGEVQPTPLELVDRQFATPPQLEPPSDDSFHHTIDAVPADVAERSTWQPDCPVALEDLRYMTVSFWGFDGGHHTGELLVNVSAVEAMADVFAQLHDARFPIEELRITRTDELDAPPTGDGNVSGAFVCRPTVQNSSWSEHASGLAIDLNPFHNPYVRDDAVIPELASVYLDRDDRRPGMIIDGGVVTRAFADNGWEWGGTWQTSKDFMHFSPSGR